MYKWPFLLLLLLSCTGKPSLSVYNQPIHKKYYASAHAETPDPKRERGEVGQRLVVTWSLSHSKFRKAAWQAKLIVQFGNRTEETFIKEIASPKGDWILKWSGRPYIDKRGVVSYKAELICDGKVVDVFEHQLWCELIRLED